MMKGHFMIWLIAVFMLSSCSSNNINSLFNEAKKTDEYIAFTVPKWVIRTVDKNVFEGHLGKTDQTENLLKNVNKARVLVQHDTSKLNMDKIHAIVAGITQKKNYYEYLSLRHKGKRTSIVVNEDSQKIKDLLLVTISERHIVLLHLESDIAISTFENGDFFKKVNI